ncbi:MAG: HAD hydrolase-like protein [Lachnospiraceae bacterium]|nr:HAD hydrolase-like protein [Lachnospiraceae bacterium]
MAQLKPEETWYIGDNYECDIVGARNAGLFPVWYTRRLSLNRMWKKNCFKSAVGMN